MARDYKAEYARRKARMQERLGLTPGQYRYRMERGKVPALAPNRLKRQEVIDTQSRLRASITYEEARALISKEQACRDWSVYAGKTPIAKFTPRDAKRLGLTKQEYIEAYYNAFVAGDESYRFVRHAGGSEPLRRWFVDIHHYYEADEYDDRYTSR